MSDVLCEELLEVSQSEVGLQFEGRALVEGSEDWADGLLGKIDRLFRIYETMFVDEGREMLEEFREMWNG